MAKSGVIVINKMTGEFTVDLTGYKGKGCSIDAAQLTRGSKVTKDIHKKEWSMTQTASQQQENKA